MFKTEIAAAIDAQSAEQPEDLGLLREDLKDIPHEAGFATIVTGVRRCGKSTLLAQWARKQKGKTVCVLFDDLRLLNFTSDDFTLLGKILIERAAKSVILDEIQDVPGWERFVAGLLPKGISVYVTGSNAKMLSRELGTKLTGRHLDLHLAPFNYREFVSFTKGKPSTDSFDDYLATGGFPAYVRARNRKILSDLFNDILYRDVVVRYGITNAAPVRQLAAYLLAHIGTRLSPSRLKDAIHVSAAKTVLDYFNHLTECCLIERLERFADSPKARLLAPKKVYACDTGLVRIVETADGLNLGHKLENIIYLQLKRQGGDLTYYLDEREHECDFIRSDDVGNRQCVQVCWELTDDNRQREIDGLVAALKRFGLRHGTIVTHAQSDIAVSDGCEITIVPAHKYLWEKDAWRK